MKIEKLPLRSGYMPLPLVNPNGFGYWHRDYMWYYRGDGTYVRPGSGEMLTLKMRLVGDMPLPMVNPTGAGGFGYWHMDRVWYYTGDGVYVRRNYGTDGEWI